MLGVLLLFVSKIGKLLSPTWGVQRGGQYRICTRRAVRHGARGQCRQLALVNHVLSFGCSGCLACSRATTWLFVRPLYSLRVCFNSSLALCTLRSPFHIDGVNVGDLVGFSLVCRHQSRKNLKMICLCQPMVVDWTPYLSQVDHPQDLVSCLMSCWQDRACHNVQENTALALGCSKGTRCGHQNLAIPPQ